MLIDIKWNVMKIIQNYVPEIIFTSKEFLPPSIATIKTNIDGNANNEFWHSVGTEMILRDFIFEYNACISWAPEEGPYYIYGSVIDEDGYGSIRLMAEEINKYISECLVVNALCRMLRKKMGKFAYEYSTIKKFSLLKKLKLKSIFDAESFFEARFLNEYECRIKTREFDNVDSLRKNTDSIIKRSYKNLNKSVIETKRVYDENRKLYENSILYNNTVVNYKLQWAVLVIAIVSLFLSIHF